MKSLVAKHPIWFALGITVAITVLGLLAFIVGSKILGLPEILVVFAPLVISAAIALGLIGWLGWWRDAGFVSTANHTYILSIVIISELVLPLVCFGTVKTEPILAIIFILAFFLTGLGEEALTRGLFIRLFLANSKWQAVLIPSILFGLSHITHLLNGTMTPVQNTIQIVNAFIGALMYGSSRLRINSIWPLIVIHTFHDVFFSFAGFSGPGATRGLDDVPPWFYAIRWALSLALFAYIMTRTKVTATIDGQAVG